MTRTSRRCRSILSTQAVSEPTFIGAARWIRELANRGVQESTRRIRTAPRYRDLTPTQYHNAFEWLKHLGVVNASGLSPQFDGASAAALVLSRYLEVINPAWLGQIDDLVRSSSDFPIDIVELIKKAEISESLVLEASRGVARKFDDQKLREIGRKGESLLLDELKGLTDKPTVWVSETDDTAGFDIFVGDLKDGVEVEVKSTVVLSRVRFYLSRNEFQRMRSSDRWSLQIVVLDDQGIAAVRYVDHAWIEQAAPHDVDEHSAWQSARFEVPPSQLSEGLHPRILRVLGPLPKQIDLRFGRQSDRDWV